MDNNITYGKNGNILWIRLCKQHERKIRFESHRTFLQDCLAKEVIPKGLNLKWTISLGSNGGGDTNIKNILNDTSEKLLNETLTFVNYKCYQPQENIRKQREILAHKYNHAQLQTQENAWKNEMKSLHDKYTRNKTRKLTTHKCSLISTNEFLTLHSNSETVCDNTNCDQSSTIAMQKDGNCFFRCISNCLHNTEVYHENIRHEVTNTLSKNMEFYSQLIDGDFVNYLETLNIYTSEN